MRIGHADARGLVETRINYWPSLVDLMASVITILVLVNVLQVVMVDDADAARARAAQLRLEHALKSHFSDAKDSVEIHLSPNLLQISFSKNLLFETREYEMENKGQAIVERAAKVLISSEVEYEQIQVEGHTDSDPYRPGGRAYPSNNWELSSARATNVLMALLKAHIPASQLSATGYADTRPVPNASKDRNRRIELRILFVTPDAQWTR
jgi:flagellar motor protein MotB